MIVDATCTPDKIMVQSDNPIPSKDLCDGETRAKEICSKLDKTFFKHFRTAGGHCNNVQNPVLGSKGSRLSRLLPAEHRRLEKPTFFEKPKNNSKLNTPIIYIYIS